MSMQCFHNGASMLYYSKTYWVFMLVPQYRKINISNSNLLSICLALEREECKSKVLEVTDETGKIIYF